jgi:hypothetical protein
MLADCPWALFWVFHGCGTSSHRNYKILKNLKTKPVYAEIKYFSLGNEIDQHCSCLTFFFSQRYIRSQNVVKSRNQWCLNTGEMSFMKKWTFDMLCFVTFSPAKAGFATWMPDLRKSLFRFFRSVIITCYNSLSRIEVDLQPKAF